MRVHTLDRASRRRDTSGACRRPNYGYDIWANLKTATVTQRTVFYPYGQVWAHAQGANDMRFAAMGVRVTFVSGEPDQVMDFTLFRNHHSRLYRWLSPDPLAGSILNPQSLNRYTYVLNNPVNLVDPLGLDPTCTVTIIDNDQLLTSQQLAEAQLEIINIFKQAGIGVMFNQNNPDFTVNLVPQPKFWQAGVPPDALARNDAFFQGLFGLASSATAFTERIANEVGANIGPAVGRVVAHEFGHFALQLVHKKWNPDELEVGIMAQGLNWLFSGQNFDPQAHVPRLKQVCEERSAARTGQAGGGRGGGPSGVPTGGRGGGGSAGAGVIVPVYAPGEGGGWVLSGYWLYPNSPPPGPRRR